jgi:plastocyanin
VSRLRLALGLAAAAAVPLGIGAACFSERAGGPTFSGAAECRVPVTVIDSMHFVVAINNFAFLPDSIAVPLGATVTWVNCESPLIEPHTTTSDSAGWSSPQFAAGERFTRRFDADTGKFTYHCEPHPFMVGKVVVQ